MPRTTTETKQSIPDKIWNDIKNVKVKMFALPEQRVDMYCEPINIEPTALYLTFKVQAVLPAMEEALASKYTVERVNKYICVKEV